MPKLGRVKVAMTSALAAYLNSEREFYMEADSIGELFKKLSERFGDAFKQRVFDESGQLRQYVVVYVNGRNISFLGGMNTSLKDGDEVMILPAIGGG